MSVGMRPLMVTALAVPTGPGNFTQHRHALYTATIDAHPGPVYPAVCGEAVRRITDLSGWQASHPKVCRRCVTALARAMIDG